MEQTQVVQEPQAQPAQEPVQAPQEDIISRVSKVQLEKKDADNPKEEVFNVNDIEKITDPVAKEQALKAYKSFERGYQHKFQDLASQRKQLETEKESLNKWTPEKVQSLLQNEEFVRSAQAATQAMAGTNNSSSGITDEEFSALSDREKREFVDMKQKLDMLSSHNTQMMLQQQDEQNKSKYANYEPGKVDELAKKISIGHYQATREDAWKVIDYNDAVRRAYELGLQDRNVNVKQKMDISSVEGVNINSQEKAPEKLPNESGVQYFKRIAINRLNQARQKEPNK